MKKIHAISSALLRPNGIVEYIRAWLEVDGGMVVTDHRVSSEMPFDYAAAEPTLTPYQPSQRDGHPWLSVDFSLVRALANAIKAAREQMPDAVIWTHDVMAELACRVTNSPSVFVQHESDIYYPAERQSYLDDGWLGLHRDLLTTGVGGVIVTPPAGFQAQKLELVPYPAKFAKRTQTHYEADVVVFCDSSNRKGWDIYFKWWQIYGRPTTSVVSFEPHPEWPPEWNVVSFAQDRTEDKLQFIANHRIGVIPSRSEVACLALVEVLSQIPAYIDFNQLWTRPFQDQARDLNTLTGDNIR